MNLAFTICTASYLPFAKALGDSLVQHNPDYVFKIVLLDDFKADEKAFQPHQIIPIADMKVNGFEEMNNRYTVFELSCALKPFAISYFFQTEPAVASVAYFDSDILVYGPFAELNTQLQQHAIVITPHITAPILEDGCFPTEEIIMRSGIYNAGFLAVSRKPEAFRFLAWWSNHLRTKCYKDVPNGLFDDQIWLNLVPVFFSDVVVFSHLGYNAAYWNMHERKISRSENGYWVNDAIPLIFFHYSGYDLSAPELISKHQTRYQFSERPEMLPLFNHYVEAAKNNGLEKYAGFKSGYGISKDPPPKKTLFQKLFKS